MSNSLARRIGVAVLRSWRGAPSSSEIPHSAWDSFRFLRLFLNWIDAFHEAHFAIIREIYNSPSSTRYDIWVAIYGETIPREDSADADVFKMLVSDLNIGRVIRLRRDSDPQGRWQRKTPVRRAPRQTTLESAFEDTKPWVLTELGSQFVSYSMTELVQRLNAESQVDDTQ